jgi:hypothetical protein
MPIDNLASQLDQYLKGKGSPLAGLGGTFVNAGSQYGVDPRLLVAISGGETSFGKTGNAAGIHNAWGWGPGRSFPDWQSGIDAIAQGLGKNYIGQGLTTIPQIAAKWAPVGAANDPRNLNSNWVRTISQFYNELGGKGVGVPKAPGLPPGPALPSSSAVVPSSGSTQYAPPDFAGALLGSLGQSPSAQLNAIVSAVAAPRVALPGTETLPSGAPPPPMTPTVPRGDFKPGSPVPVNMLSSIGAEHPTAGLDGYPAFDYMAKAGTPVVAPVGGKIVRFSGHDPSAGPTDGVHGPFGWSLYLQGTDGRNYYMTHLGSRDVKVGQTVRPGAVLGTIGDYAKWGGADHVHMGVH